jgi:hypothetical protein
MNALAMQYAVEKRTGQLNRFSPDKLPSYMIEDYLNLSQDVELKDIYSRVIGSARTKFEFTEKIRRELGNLIQSYTTTDLDGDSEELHENAVFATLPTDYLYGVEEKCIVNSDGDTSIAKVIPMTHDEYRENISNPFLNPNEDTVWRLDFGFTGATGAKKHELVHDSDISIESYTARYIKRPQKIVLHPTNYQDCELDKSTHDNIVNRVVSMITPRKEEK